MSAAPRIRRITAALALLVAVGAAAWRAPRPVVSDFVTTSTAVAALAPKPPALHHVPVAPLADDFLPRVAPTAHGASLVALADGDVAAAWFAGSREGAPDVSIYLSRWHAVGRGGVWSAPVAVATREGVQAATGRYVRKLGNPVLGQDSDGRLHLWFVSVAFGGWAGSALNHQVSEDGGLTWSGAQRLVTSPFLNISTLVRNPPLWPDHGGGVALPVYHEFIAKHGEWLRLDDQGRVVDKVRLPQPRRALQPAVAPLGNGELLALLRDAGPGPGHVLSATSPDGGAHWQAGAPLPIANPNAAVALLRLTNGSLLLACNPVPGNRNRLSLWLSPDQGANWREVQVLDASDDGDDEFSYPALAQDSAGRIHVVYTWKRETLRHHVFAANALQESRP